MTWDRVERLIGKDNLHQLSQKKVGVVGLGSGGGFVAQSLAMSGVHKFVLIDDDTLEGHNITRHVADNRDVGRNKAKVLADLIKFRNPNATIDAITGRIEKNLDILDDLDVLAVCVDGEQTKYVINEACLERNLVAIYAGVYERGEGGDTAIIQPYNGPCYACWAAELREGFGDTDEQLDYGMIGPEGTLEAEPGLWLHVVRVASTQSDFILKYLLNDFNLPANTVVLANNALEIVEGEVTPPHSCVWVNIQRDPNCLVCSKKADEDEIVSLDDLDIDIDFDDNVQQSQQ